MRRRYLRRVRAWVVLANTAVAVAVGGLIAFAVATQIFPPIPDSAESEMPGHVRRLDFTAGLASGAPVGEAIFVRAPGGATLFDFDGLVLARFEGVVASFAWLGNGSGVLMRSPEGQTGPDASTNLPVIILELDGGVTRLPLEASEPTVAAAALSPDGKWIAFGGDGLVIVERDGSELRRVEHEIAPETFLGWDAKGRLVIRRDDDLSLVSVDGERSAVALPATLRGLALSRVPGGDPGDVVLLADRGLWRLAERSLNPIAPECLAVWVAPHEVLCAAGTRTDAFDITSGSRRRIAALIDDRVRDGMRVASDGVVLWIDGANVVRSLDLSTGVDRLMEGVPATARLEPLQGARFLASDLAGTYLVAPRAP